MFTAEISTILNSESVTRFYFQDVFNDRFETEVIFITVLHKKMKSLVADDFLLYAACDNKI